MEFRAAYDAGDMVVATTAGAVTEVSSDLIIVAEDDGELHDATRCASSRAPTRAPAINQRPIVTEGQRVEVGQVLADGPSTDQGETRPRQEPAGCVHAVGRPQLRGRHHPFPATRARTTCSPSIHIEEQEIDARDTKLGPEEITRDIPNVSEEVLADLDERGIIRIGADVVPGDILVGKVTPKGETELTPEERLLRAIFGEKAREVRDTSLKVPHGESGKVIGVRVFDSDEGDELPAGRESPRPGVRRAEAQDHRRRQARRPPRQQGCHRQDPSRRRHAVHERRHAGRHLCSTRSVCPAA